MKQAGNIRISKRYVVYAMLAILLLAFNTGTASAQEDPPRPITITATAQSLGFGTFYHYASGGSVIISPAGSRSKTGDVVLFGGSFSAALFEVRGNPGTVVSLLTVPDATLTRGGGGSMTLKINFLTDSNPSSPFVLTQAYPNPTTLSIGGTLLVSGNPMTNPAGSYSGTFNITLNQE